MATVTEIRPTKKVVTQIERSPSIIKKKLRVCAYARVSTKLEEQENSYELQMSEYTKRISENPEWIFAGMYSDKGISGTSTKNREGFNKMIKAALNGEIDLILTKSISRFGRNVSDVLKACQQLRDAGVEIRFEKEHITNMDQTTDFLMAVMSGIAQEESRSISENLTWAIRTRFKEGIHRLNVHSLYGYSRDENDNIVIDDEKADVIRRIYVAFIVGLTPHDIAEELNNAHVPTLRKGKWTYGRVKSILQNEKYCGDAILQKSYTVNYLTHKRKKNEGEVPSYYVKDDHIPIVSKEDFEKVKALLEAQALTSDRNTCKNLSLYKMVYCATCGNEMKRVPGSDKRNKLWCGFKNNNSDCNSGYTDYEDIENALLRVIETMSDSQTIVDELNQILATCEEYSTTKTRITNLEYETAELIKSVDKLIDLKIKTNQLSEKEFKAKYDSLQSKIKENEKLLETLEEEYKKKSSSAILFQIQVNELFAGNKIAVSNQLFRRLFRAVLYKDKAIKIVLNTPSAAGLSINELIKTCNKQKVIYQEDMLFGVKRKLHVEVVHYGK